MSAIPAYVTKPNIAVGSIATANTNRDGTGTIGTILTAASGGTRVDRVKVYATGTTTAGMVRVYLYDGSTARLHDEVAVTAITPGATTAAFTSTITYTNGWFIPTGMGVRASTHNAETFLVFTEGGDL